MPVTTQKTLEALLAPARDAFRDTIEQDFFDQVDSLMSAEEWSWPNETRRASGQVAGVIRDVIDTGQLADTGNRDLELSIDGQGVSAVVTWLAPYSAAVFLGAVFKARSYTMPGRNVPDEALNRLDFATAFARNLRARL